jgi:uroporphyrinogen III methyltransferase/synthase
VRTTLAGLPDVVLEPPVTLVIGRVAGLDLRWFEGRPLFGRRIVVTRARAQASTLVERLTRLGAEAIELPTIEIADPGDGGVALDAAAARLHTYDWVVFTSANAVERLFDHLRDARAFGGARVASIGPGTAAALAERGVVSDLQPDESVGEALVDAFPVGPGTVLVPQAAAARPVVADGLRAKGWAVDVVEAYRTVPVRPTDEALAAAAKADAVAFTSSSTVTSWLDLAGRASLPPVVACIGPVTAATATEHGLPVTVVAADHTVAGLVDALVAALRVSP